MQDGATWIKVDEDKYCNLAALTFLEEGDDETILWAGGQGPPAQPVRVTDGSARRQIHAFVERAAASAQTAALAPAR